MAGEEDNLHDVEDHADTVPEHEDSEASIRRISLATTGQDCNRRHLPYSDRGAAAKVIADGKKGNDNSHGEDLKYPEGYQDFFEPWRALRC